MKKTKVLSCIVVLVVLMSTMQSSLISSVSAAPIIPDPGVTVDKSSICCGGIIIVTVPVQNLKTETKNICIEIEIKDSAGNTIDSKTKSKSMGPGPYSYFTWKQSFQIKKPCENFGTYTVEVTVKEGSTVHDSDTVTFAVKDCEPKPTPTPTEVKFSGRVTDKAPEGWTGSYWWDVKVDEWISGTMPCDIIRVGFVVLPDVPIGSYNMTLDIGDYVEVYGPVDPPCYVSLNGESYYIKYVPEAVKEVKFRGEILADYPIISFYSFDVKIAEILDDPTGNLQEGETVNVYGHRDGPAQVDDVTVGDEVEVFGEYRGYVGTYEQIFLSDCDESSSDHYVKKIEEKKPDLIIQDIYWSPANPKKGDAVTFTVKIKNQGSGSAGSSTVKYYIDDSYITSDSMPALSAGFTSTQTFTWTANKCGNVQVKAIADYFDDVDESNEGNNERTETLSIPCKPDLIIQDISGSPSTPKNGDTVTFTVTIKNQGSGSADGFYVCYYVDDSYYDRDYVSSLSAGSTKTTSFSWTAESGSHTIKAIADCYDAIGESNEGNNEKSITIEIEEESEEIKFIGTLTARVMPMGFTRYFFKVDRVLEGSIPVGDEIGVMVYASGVYPLLNNYDLLDIGDKAEVYAVFLKKQGKQYDPWVDREVWSADITGNEKYYVEKISPKTIYVDDDFVYDDPPNHKWNTIQEGIIDANDGDTILVYLGTYTENVEIPKSLTIKSTSGNSEDTTVQAAVSNQNYQNVFTVTADNVNIDGFTIKGASYFWCSGVYINGSNCIISNNTFEDNAVGVWIFGYGEDRNITIRNNNFSSSSGYSPSTALYLEASGNKIYLNKFIIGIKWSCWLGNIWNSTGKITYTYKGNSFTNYLGNYWDDYEEKYPHAKEKDGSGIWDTAYSIDDDRDYYPLVERFENYFVGAEEYNPNVSVPPCAPTSEEAYIGTTFQFVVNVTNDGTLEDTIDLSVSDTWGAEISEDSVFLLPGEFEYVYVDVIGKELGRNDINVMATSRNDSSKYSELMLRSYAHDTNPLFIQMWRYAPLSQYSSTNTIVSKPEYNKWEVNDGGIILMFFDLERTTENVREAVIGIKNTETGESINLNIKLADFDDVEATNFHTWRDGYSFPNWKGWVFFTKYWKKGCCYGMSETSILYFDGRLGLPDTTNTNNLTKEQAKGVIKVHQAESFLHVPSHRDSRWCKQEKEYEKIVRNITKGNPVILDLANSSNLKSEKHAVVAYKIVNDSDTSFIYIYDPNFPYGNLLNVTHSYIRFDLTISEFEYSDYNVFIVLEAKTLRSDETILFIECPVGATITDQYGRIISDDGTNEIPDADIVITDKIKIFYLPADLTYSIEIEAYDSGIFNFSRVSPIGKDISITKFENIPITSNTKASVDIVPDETNYTMSIDYDGDGVYEKTIIPDLNETIIVSWDENIFDTRASTNPYPSITGTHTGTIKPNQDITVQKLYTYPCAGTGGHTESVRIYGNEIDESASWEGYAEDWHNMTFDDSFTLEGGKTYNYVIETGSYPQIHHTEELQTENGWINCTKFTDANGKDYYDKIPAIKLF